MKKIIISITLYAFIYVMLSSAMDMSINNFVKIENNSYNIFDTNNSNTSWGDHFIIFIITYLITNYVASYFTGLIIRRKDIINGGLIFSAVGLAIQAFVYFNIPAAIREQSIISIGPFNMKEFPIASWFAIISHFITGHYGYVIGSEDEANALGDEGRIIGVKWIHWLWIFFPVLINPIMLILGNICHSILVASKYLANDVDFLTHILALIAIIPIAISVYSLHEFYKFLVDDHNDSNVMIFFKGGGILILGITIGLVSQLVIFGSLSWIESKIH